MNSDLTIKKKKARYNIETALIFQLVTMVCGIITPRLLLGAFGSEIYGACSSITQFLAYIALIEGGVSGVARAALYKPLSQNDGKQIGKVLNEIKYFFRIIGTIFVVYVIIIACSFKTISNITCLNWISTFALVLVISISTFAQYFIGISNAVLIQADQRSYVTNIISTCTTIINCLLVVVLVVLGTNIIVVKLMSSVVFAMKPVAQWLYVKRKYSIVKTREKDSTALEQKWTAFGQHIAYFLHSNTDVMVLTIFSGLKTVSVYSVYYMIISAVQGICTSFSTGMEAFFWSLYAEKQKEELLRTFDFYETLISFVAITLFSITAVLITPFVQIYTRGIVDANYYQPLFGILLLSASILYCMRQPYHSMVMAAGHFRQTKIAAYGEAILNITISIILVKVLGLPGVAIGTIAATAFRMIYYVMYLQKNIISRSVSYFVKRFVVNVLSFSSVFVVGNCVLNYLPCNDYFQWIIVACIVTVMALGINLLTTGVFYPNHFKPIISKVFRIKK